MVLLLAAPSAMEYYPKISYEKVENSFIQQKGYIIFYTATMIALATDIEEFAQQSIK